MMVIFRIFQGILYRLTILIYAYPVIANVSFPGAMTLALQRQIFTWRKGKQAILPV